VAAGLATIARQVDAATVIAKGGITAATTARDGLGAATARVIGPVQPGVSFWKLPEGRALLVVPGNVGDVNLLRDLVAVIDPKPPRIPKRHADTIP
jgi:uncharacterized protein YgbK (DUF1537 family)